MKHLIIFSIGPVQDFIATARRSRDLWYGSWMLSELSKAAARAIGEPPSLGELIFPSPANTDELKSGSQFTAPNKIVALVDGKPDDVADKVNEAIKSRMSELWEDAKSNINKKAEFHKDKLQQRVANQQIEDLLELYWVSVPFDDSDDNNYASAREQAEALLAARKATRNFEQPMWSSNVPKSSLDGAHESVIPEAEYPERGDPNDEKWKKDNLPKIESLYKNYHARRGERLSGVDLLKRLGDPEKSPDFESTSDMAAIPFIQALDKDGGKGQKLLKKIRGLLPDDADKLDKADEGLIFEARLKDEFPLQELPDATREIFVGYLKNLPKPNPYYALLAADGDFMGKIIDGHQKKDAHQRISSSLAEFATGALAVVKKYQGVPIYSGGDDVLAYLPLNTVLLCALELESSFHEKMKGYAITESGRTITPTFSIGIVVVHHLDPLSEALELVRKAEKNAKGVEGKNGLAIILSKRSGADRPIVSKFGKLYKRLETLMALFAEKAISGGAAYELQTLYRALLNTSIPMAREAIRIISRKRESGGQREIDPNVVQEFMQWIDTDKIPLDELAREMIVAKELSGE
ncbi:MAG: type III-B CRISPR-associated protein Cas10/Cmr2 [Chloroflexota bacterium]